MNANEEGSTNLEKAIKINASIYEGIIDNKMKNEGQENFNPNDNNYILDTNEDHGIIGSMIKKTDESIDVLNEYG